MVVGYPYFWKHPYEEHESKDCMFLNNSQSRLFLVEVAFAGNQGFLNSHDVSFKITASR